MEDNPKRRWFPVWMLLPVLFFACTGSSDTVVSAVPDDFAEMSTQPALRLVLGGDVMFGRWRDDEWRQWVPCEEALGAIGDRLRRADLAVVNLETAICDHHLAEAAAPYLRGQTHRLTALPSHLDWLVGAGIRVAVVANNHTMDCGPQSMEHTLRYLNERRIAAAGVGRFPEYPFGEPAVVSFGPHRAVVLAVTTHPPTIGGGGMTKGPATLWRWREDLPALIGYIETVRQQYPQDLLIVSLHWGQELAKEPSPFQRRAARRLIHAGADVIYGHGSHVLQEVELYRQGVVVYSAGNLIFDMTQPQTKKPGLVELGVIKEQTRKDRRWRIEKWSH